MRASKNVKIGGRGEKTKKVEHYMFNKIHSIKFFTIA